MMRLSENYIHANYVFGVAPPWMTGQKEGAL